MVVIKATTINAEYKLVSINQNLYIIKIIANSIAPLLFIARPINQVWDLDKWSKDAQINVPINLDTIATVSKTIIKGILTLNTSKLKFTHILTKKNGINNKLETNSIFFIGNTFLQILLLNIAHTIKATKDQTTNSISLGLNFHKNKVIHTKASIHIISSIIPDSNIIVHTLVFNLPSQNNTSAVVHSAVILKHIQTINDTSHEYHSKNNTSDHATKGIKKPKILIYKDSFISFFIFLIELHNQAFNIRNINPIFHNTAKLCKSIHEKNISCK